jgi:hypothetical protein
MVPSTSMWHPWVPLVLSVLWVLLAVALHYGLTRLTHNPLGLFGIWLLVSMAMLPLLAFIWGGEFVIHLWTSTLIWVQITNGLTFQIFGFGWRDFCLFSAGCTRFPHHGTLALDHQDVALYLVPAIAFSIYSLVPRGK